MFSQQTKEYFSFLLVKSESRKIVMLLSMQRIIAFMFSEHFPSESFGTRSLTVCFNSNGCSISDYSSIVAYLSDFSRFSVSHDYQTLKDYFHNRRNQWFSE